MLIKQLRPEEVIEIDGAAVKNVTDYNIKLGFLTKRERSPNVGSIPFPASVWQPIETAPTEVRIIVYCSGGPRFGIKDKYGNWRARHNGPIRLTPTRWMHQPPTPKEIE